MMDRFNSGPMARRTVACVLAIAGLAASTPVALGQITDENPPVMLQWFECPWRDMERRMTDWFVAGYGSVWLPPVSRGYVSPTRPNQNGDSAGYDPFDRFDLGKPGATTAYGTEAFFGNLVDEYHRANGLVYVDMVLNHNAGRQTSQGFMNDGGYPGFWMNPPTPMRDKLPTDNWGDFNNGVASGYYQSENPGGSRYCLLNGDLVALIDINHSSNHYFIRQPVEAGNPQNIPGGTYFNLPSAGNRRFYTDQALGTVTVSNPGMSYAGPLNTGVFSAPCDIPARNESASQLTMGKFNSATPPDGDPVVENATGYLNRWTQWMLDVQKVDGFRIDAIKHMPSWFYDTYYDSVVHARRTTPDGRQVTPYSFGECVEGNDFTFDRYIRKPNGRTSGRLTIGDAFGNRDALDLNGAGGLRDVINGFTGWADAIGRHLDNVDDGYNNGSIGVHHIWSHDNGSAGNGGSAPSTPTSRQQGWFAHAYLIMRPGQAKIFHNARGVNRSGGFWPRAGLTPVFGVEPTANTSNPIITNLVQLSNSYARGWYYPKWTDNEVHIFERATPVGAGLSGNVLVACNRSYSGSGITSYDERTFNTSFPQGTRLLEQTGNAARSDVDPSNQIAEVITVGVNGSVTVRVPRNQNINGVEHNRGFVIYAPAVPAGTLALTGQTGTLPVEGTTVAPWRRRLNAVPVIGANSFEIQLTTVNGDSGAPNNDNADDNALFRIDAGYVDWNGNGVSDIDYQNGVVPGHEEFVTQRQPLASTSNTNGIYRQVIDATRLDEGTHYLSVAAFRKRAVGDAPLFREFRTAFYVDRLDPTAEFIDPGVLAENTLQYKFEGKALDRTVSRIHLILNPPTTSDPLSLAVRAGLSGANEGTQDDRTQWSRQLTGLQNGANTVLMLAFEESGRGMYQYATVYVGTPPCITDYNQDGGGDTSDVLDLANDIASGQQSFPPNTPDFNQDGGADTSDVIDLANAIASGECP